MIETRQQQWAERAYQQVSKVAPAEGKEYKSFSASFPALVHGCGLCQALAFAHAKSKTTYLNDLAKVLGTTIEPLMDESRAANTPRYQLLSREVMEAAAWLKRYAEAAFK